MEFSNKQNFFRWVLISISLVLVTMILWNTYSFFQIFKIDERLKMEHWAAAQKTINDAPVDADIELPLKILQSTRIPIIVVQKDLIVNFINIDKNTTSDKNKLTAFLQDLKTQNKPIKQEYASEKFQYLYYGNSSLLNKLKYYPIALLLIILLFVLLVYNYYHSTKIATQNKLWTGMAKETAHQIGTPLSSLMGWLEIIKVNNVDESTISEIEKDITRLQTIADRFSKIGSKPVLEILDIVKETKKTYDYLLSRFSKQITFSFYASSQNILLKINPVLHSWTIENLVKNAIDAMKGKGKIDLSIKTEGNFVNIFISDTGRGISKKQFKKIFEPGFTTKKRGWGLGLSLTKRIVEEYHNGKILVLNSEIGNGTTIQMKFKML